MGSSISDDPTSSPPEPVDPASTEAEPRIARLSFPVVGIGASAGGLEALEALTHRLSADRMAFVIVQHLAPGHVSMLSDILRRGTTLPVVTIEDGMRLEAGTIYVAPPVGVVSIAGEELHLTASDGRAPRHSIDAFFRSLAHAGGSMAIGVVLSGSGSDGTLGLKAIKDEGGITFVQDPGTAAQSSMPQSAANSGSADFSLTPAEIGDELVRLSTHPYVGRARAIKLVHGSAIGKILERLRVAHGVDFALYKQGTVERRIARRLALHKLESVDDYLTVLDKDGHELGALYNDLLIGVTSFFRDAEPFEALKSVVFPRMLENRSQQTPIRIWIAGCATGEEAYSIVIALLEYLGDRASSYRIQIFATDIDEEGLARARTAVYPPNIELDVSPERLERFFTKTDHGYQIARHLRDLIVFAHHNLGKDPPFSHLDLVTCRNVLIYMQTRLQKKVLRIFHYALKPDACLLLGTSESVGDAADLFSLHDRKLKVYVKKNIPPTAVFDFVFAGRPDHETGEAAHRTDIRPLAGLAQLADRKILEKYAPPGIIVDDKLDVVQFRGRTGPYLEPTPGAATLHLLKLTRPELLVAVRTTIHRSLTEALPASSLPVPMWSETGTRAVAIDVMPLADDADRRCFLVLFRDVTPEQLRPADAPALGGGLSAKEPRIIELERELAANKEYLQSSIEELEAANEELQSSNEELQSSNEELQSTNEELETSKEELQSTNEELATVNDELHSRMEQLSLTNDDLQNVLINSTGAIVIVGADLRIRRFSVGAEKLLSLIPGDVGRPIAYLRNVMSASDIEQIASDAISTVSAREQRVRCIDGSWYLMKLAPYLTSEHMIRGLVLEFVTTAAPGAIATGVDLPPLALQVLSALPSPIMLVDRSLRVVWANKAFFDTFSLSPSSLGQPLAAAWGSTKEPQLWAFLDDLLAGRPVRDLVVDRPFGRSSERPIGFSGKLIASDGVHPSFACIVMRDA
jgi:two-component system CheB/CheR fusion protein